MYDEWAHQDFSSLAIEAFDGQLLTETPQTLSIIDVGADLADAGFGPDAGVVSGAITPFIVEDDFLDLGGKYFDVGPLANRDGLPDGGTVDEIEVPGVPRDVEVPETDPGTGHDYGGGSGGGSGDQSPPPQSPFPEVLQSYLDALRDFVRSINAGDDNRNATSRFDRDPQQKRDFRVGDTTVYWDTRTSSFWFDADGSGDTPETEFWVFGDGVWFDYTNDGNPDTRVVSF